MSEIETAGVGSMDESQNLEWKTSWRDEYLKCILGITIAQERRELELGGFRLGFVSGDTAQGTDRSAEERAGTESTRLESQSESQLESLATRVLRRQTDRPISTSGLPGALEKFSVSGQLNKSVRALRADGSIGYTISEESRIRLQTGRQIDAGSPTLEGLSNESTRGMIKGVWREHEASF